MKRWDANHMLEIGKKLFAKIHRQKKHANHNHDVHFMAREIVVLVYQYLLGAAARCYCSVASSKSYVITTRQLAD
jgi:hypothetical protein